MDHEDRAFLAANLWAVENFAEDRLAEFVARGPDPMVNWINELLLYDRSVIPVQDYLAPSVLVVRLGQRNVIDLLESSVLSFVRVMGGVAFCAPGVGGSQTGGFVSFVLPRHMRGRGREQPEPRSTTEVVQRASTFLRQALSEPVDSRLVQLLQERTTEVSPAEFITQVGERLLDELRDDVPLREWAGVQLSDGELVLPGKQGTLSVYSGVLNNGEQSPGQNLAAMLGANTELWIAASVGCHDLSTTGPVEKVLARRTFRHLCTGDRDQSFATICRLEDVPDPGRVAFADPDEFRKLLRLRRSRAGLAFRGWFHEKAASSDPIDVSRALVQLLREEDFVAAVPMRVMRFLTTSVVGSVPVVGTAISALDAFVVDRLFRNRSAKFFVDRLRQFGVDG